MIFCIHSCCDESAKHFCLLMGRKGHTTLLRPVQLTTLAPKDKNKDTLVDVLNWYTEVIQTHTASEEDVYVQGSPEAWEAACNIEGHADLAQEAGRKFKTNKCTFILLNDTPSRAVKTDSYTVDHSRAAYWHLWRQHVQRRKSGFPAYIV